MPSGTFAPAPVCSAGKVEPLARAKELGVQTIVDRITRAIVHDDRGTEQHGGIGARLASPKGRRVQGGGGHGNGALETGLAVTVANIASFGAHSEDHSRSHSSPPPTGNQQRQLLQFAVNKQPTGGSSSRTIRPTEDVERLRRVVRDTMSSPQLLSPPSSSSTSLYGGIALAGGERCGERLHVCVVI